MCNLIFPCLSNKNSNSSELISSREISLQLFYTTLKVCMDKVVLSLLFPFVHFGLSEKFGRWNKQLIIRGVFS